MLKGCQKRMIMIKDTGSDIFEQAYFIIKDAEICERVHNTDMLREANRIIEENLLCACFPGEKKKKKPRSVRLSFVLGFLLGSFSLALLWILVAAT